MYLRKLAVTNWMIHKATTVKLFPVTVFVRSNNGGSRLYSTRCSTSRWWLENASRRQGPYSFAARRHREAARSARIGHTVDLAASASAEYVLPHHITYSQQRSTSEAPKYAIYDETLIDSSGTTLFHRGEEVYGIDGVSSDEGSPRPLSRGEPFAGSARSDDERAAAAAPHGFRSR